MIDSNQDEAVKLEAERSGFGKTSGANQDCLAKAKADEPVFIILGRDPDGGNLVRLWAQRRAEAGDVYHAGPVFAIADAMDKWAADPANAPESAPPASAYPALTRTTPANLNAPDKQEALAGEGVEGLVRIAAWNALRASHLPDDKCYPIIEGVVTGLRYSIAALSRTPSSPQAVEADVERATEERALLVKRASTVCDVLEEDMRREPYRPIMVDAAGIIRELIATMTTRPAGGEEVGPWEAMLTLTKAADAAAEWITEARASAEATSSWTTLPYEKGLPQGAQGKREVRNIRAAIRKARAALAPPPQAQVDGR